ncbi:ImmA/IrrE family metallo-endopeptidase [Burkholderia lata]|uniref:ImmA/IrrE family metallo-endopeptidase n=1 Tax=Burkholderia lata (strain ATCC 17760 / DSM 23089 / LMG 22485 / NCIMB 9086 / R18194 / 383) TaxID=482957 RepID=UPI00399B472A
MAKRDAILTGIARATELHHALGIRDRLKDGSRPMDVFAAIKALEITVLFRPLEGLLGAYVPTPNSAGMLVTTQRDHHVQRFTAAHELGHHVLAHRTVSLDINIGYVGRGERTGHDQQELEADSFAAEFLLPKWLIVAHARRQGWGSAELRRPEVIYQLSLRLAASYSSTCWALASADILTQIEASKLAAQPPKRSKQQAMNDVVPTSWHPDVWLLSDRDKGAQLVGSPEDFLVLNLQEHLAGGYEWDIEPIPSTGLEVRRDHRIDADDDLIGGTVTRRVVVQGRAPTRTKLWLKERRPWEGGGDAINSMEFDLALLGKEPIGLLRAERLMAA